MSVQWVRMWWQLHFRANHTTIDRIGFVFASCIFHLQLRHEFVSGKSQHLQNNQNEIKRNEMKWNEIEASRRNASISFQRRLQETRNYYCDFAQFFQT